MTGWKETKEKMCLVTFSLKLSRGQNRTSYRQKIPDFNYTRWETVVIDLLGSLSETNKFQ